MTDVQLYLALGIPFLSVVIAMVVSNSRIKDMRDLLRAEIQTVGVSVNEQRRLLDRIIARGQGATNNPAPSSCSP